MHAFPTTVDAVSSDCKPKESLGLLSAGLSHHSNETGNQSRIPVRALLCSQSQLMLRSGTSQIPLCFGAVTFCTLTLRNQYPFLSAKHAFKSRVH